MTQSSSGAGRTLPGPVFFDPSFERVPSAAAFDEGRQGPVVLVFDPAADRRWVADAAVALATAWNAGGRRTVLADLSLDDPVLHERIGMANLDGVVDLFLYGASLARTARPVPGRGFYLIPAGTYTPDPENILRHPRWDKIVAGFRDAQASLLLFVPADAPGLSALAQWAADAIVLGERASEDRLAAASAVFSPRTWLTPPAGAAVEPAPARPSAPAPPPAERFPEPERVHPFAGGTARVPDAMPEAAAATSELPVPDPTWEEPEWKGRRRRGIPKERRVSPVLLVVLVLALMAGAVAAALAFIPGLKERLQSGAAQPAPARAVRPTLAPPRAPTAAAGTPRPYAVFVRGYDNAEAARRALETVRREEPSVPFFVIPEERDGMVYHKIYAGMLGDTTEASALRARLLAKKLVNPEDVGGVASLIQERALAFDLGDFPTREAAEARADALGARGVPAYAVPVPQTDGSERWKLYGGAYADSAAAAPMKRLLEEAGLPARLVPRTGRPPATSK